MDYHPSFHARTTPEKPAIIMGGSGRTISYAELDRLSNRFAHLVRRCGLQAGDRIAFCLENHPLYLPLCWGAQRAGLIYVAISSRLTAAEVAYIVKDSGARLLIGSDMLAPVLDAVLHTASDVLQLRVGGVGPLDLDAALSRLPDTPIADERAGCDMLYSSGTTGQPKGVRTALPDDPAITATTPLTEFARNLFGLAADSVYLSPAPLYHAAPLRMSMVVHRLGGTVVVMEKFDAQSALSLIERYGVTDGQWVPTHFVRLLALSGDVRERHDLRTLRGAIHAAAPCPVPVKSAMIEWWGPILHEYYAGTENNGMTYLSSAEWLDRPGSVGRAVSGRLHICGDDGEELGTGEIGGVYFEGGGDFAYHNDPEKTAAAANRYGWTTLGDVGRVDDESYLYLTDRKSFMIISGGVNIYPQEIENLIVTHPKVADVAVIGAPDPDMGERVVAVVQLRDANDAGPAMVEELTNWLATRLSRVKLPRQIDFLADLPREPTGKLLKRKLRDAYWEAG